MKKRVNIVTAVALATSTLLLALGFIGAVTTDAAAATVRPALIKNTDEPGRTPYEVQAQYYYGGCTIGCSDAGSYYDVVYFHLPAVPAGKRWVIQHISGTIPTTSGGSVSLSSFTNSKLKWSFYGPFFPLNGISGFSSQVFTTVEPGEVLLVDIYATSHANIICDIVVSGYLIDASN
jgi:hypothetical protein